ETYTISVDWPADYAVQWSTGSTTSSITVNATGAYSVLVVSPDGCISTDEIMVEFFDYPELELGVDTFACIGQEIRLQAGHPGLDYLWNTGQLSREIYVAESGMYSVEITNGYCVSRDTVELVFHPLPTRPFDPEYAHCFEASTESFYLDAENPGATYVWSNDSISRILLILQPGTYSVEIESEFGCENEFRTTVNRECIESLYIPNSFTPDGDGVNDEWFIYGTNIVDYHLEIFNSWGELFYESFDSTRPWTGERGDGSYYVDSQVFAYIIRYKIVQDNGLLSTERTAQGFVSLIR
ncbi:MAG: gliding motility-associated C-terminal domain-containing protein, partial [Flavobacteriales bacterium]